MDFAFYLNNQPWNQPKRYDELNAAFVNPNILGLQCLDESGEPSMLGSLVHLVHNLFTAKKFTLDPTEGRMGKIMPICERYGVTSYADEFPEKQVSLYVPAGSREEAREKLRGMLSEMQDACGPDYILKVDVGEHYITIESKFSSWRPRSRHI